MNEVEKYIANFSPKIQDNLNQLRSVFHEIIPNPVESIRYGIPAYQIGKHYLYFAAYKNHIGFYPVYGLEEIENELISFRGKGTKDALHFPHKNPLPLDLIKKIILLKSRC